MKEFRYSSVVLAFSLLGPCCGALQAQTVLYNGIELPAEWPPKNTEMNCREPMPVPYLKKPPAVIPIDVGRQLFVDDFLIARSTLKRVWHKPVKYRGNPVLRPERDYEGNRTTLKCSPVIYDPADKIFKVWYMTGNHRDRCLAVSKDGIHWQRPKLDVVPGTNYVIYKPDWKDNSNGFDVELDHNATNPDERYKAIQYRKPERINLFFTSPDGVHWKMIGEAPEYIENMPGFKDRELGKLSKSFHPGDVCTFHWNPFREVWVFDVKEHHTPGRGRARFYREGTTFAELPDINPDNLVFSMGADRLDKLFPGIDNSSKLHGYMKITPQMYQRDAVAYESLMLGTFSLWYNQMPGKRIPKINQIFTGFSRDGFHWDRPDRDAFIPIEREKGVGHHEFGYLRPAGGGCVVVGDELYFYYEGCSGLTRDGKKSRNESMTINLAILRRDGFASMEAGDKVGTLETRPVTFKGKHLFVNLDAPQGELKVEVLDADGKVFAPFTRENCRPLAGDKTKLAIAWQDAADLGALQGKPVRFRFHLRRGSLYAFWVSPWETGESNGYVASGGPGYAGPRDERLTEVLR